MHFHTGGWTVDDAEPLGIPLRGPQTAWRGGLLCSAHLPWVLHFLV